MSDVLTADGITAPKFAAAFAAGCHGQVVEKYAGGTWAGFGSPDTWAGLMAARRMREDFLYGDHGYFGRGVFYRVTRNAFQHNGKGAYDMDRLRPFHEAALPWKSGRDIIVCPQSDGHHQRFHAKNWMDETMAVLQSVSDRKIIVRTKATRRPIQADLDDAWCVVTHSSACAIHGIMAGVPAICTADGAASLMSGSDPFNVEYPYRPDGRMEWAATLAANQWTLDEIKQGKCWKAIYEKF